KQPHSHRPIFFLKFLLCDCFCLNSFFFSFDAKLGLVGLRGLGLINARSISCLIFFITSSLFSSCDRCSWLFTIRNPPEFILAASLCCSTAFCSSLSRAELPI